MSHPGDHRHTNVRTRGFVVQINRWEAFSGATLVANAFRDFHNLTELENEEAKSLMWLFTDSSTAFKCVFPLIIT